MRSRRPPWVPPLLAKKASSQSLISCASRAGLLAWQRRPEQPGRPRTCNLRSIPTFMIVFGLPSSVSRIPTFLPSAWDSTPAPPRPAAAGSPNRPSPNSPPCSSCAPTSPCCQSHPGPAAVIGRHRRHHDHPAPQPAGRTTRPHRRPGLDPAALAGLTAFSVIANEGGQTSLPLILPFRDRSEP